jgi:diguanylate cyclase (GGDEF)-like protein/PAS domain S-box-containing protein
MRKPFPLALAALAGSAVNMAFALAVPAAWPVALPVALLTAWAAVHEWRRRLRARRALGGAVGLLAEFRLPLPDTLRTALPDLLQPLVRGYEEAFAQMSRRQAELAERVERYAFVEMHNEDVVMQVDALGCIRYVSPSVQAQLGYTPEELLGTRILDKLHPDELSGWIDALKHSARAHEAALLEGRWCHKLGHHVAMEMSLRHAYGLNGCVAGTIAMARNIEARNELRDKLALAATTDPLTGLPNRAALLATLQRLRAGSRERPFVLLLFDLDRFKQVNDSLGHAAGDDCLVETASRVRSILRPGDTLARMGGDEFVALFDGVESESGARAIAARIIEAVSQPYSCRGSLLHPKTSIGIVLCDEPDVPSDELISRADRAMYAAKRQGGNLAIVYDATYSDSARRDFDVEQALTRALHEQRLELHFQPIVDAKSKLPVLAEALVRMRADDGSLLGPGHFIKVAERTGQIFQVGQWVLEQACRHARRLEEAGTPVPVSVNVSPRQLLHVNYVRSVEEVLEDTGVSPSSIVLEVTESAVMEDVEKAKATLVHLRGLGFGLALDDFGSGYSSISMLQTLPFDMLKIDRSFVRDSGTQRLGATTLGAIIDIGKSQRLTIVAEGIETEEQSIALERLGCDLLQGFHFFRPMDGTRHAEVMRRGRAALPGRQPARAPRESQLVSLF